MQQASRPKRVAEPKYTRENDGPPPLTPDQRLSKRGIASNDFMKSSILLESIGFKWLEISHYELETSYHRNYLIPRLNTLFPKRVCPG